MGKRLAGMAMLVGCTQSTLPPVQSAPPQCPAQAAQAPRAPTAASAGSQPSAAPAAAPAPEPPKAAEDNGLDDFAALTFSCPKAALNAAAREAAKVRSEGSYQFSHFDFISDTHQAVYEVHFKSNYPDEPLLRYCVAIYCQMGWDPKSTQASVTLMSEPGPAAKGSAQVAACGDKHTHAAARRIE